MELRESSGEVVGDIGSEHRVGGEAFGSVFAGNSVEVDAEEGRLCGADPLSQDRGNDAGQDIARTGGGHSGIAARDHPGHFEGLGHHDIGRCTFENENNPLLVDVFLCRLE